MPPGTRIILHLLSKGTSRAGKRGKAARGWGGPGPLSLVLALLGLGLSGVPGEEPPSAPQSEAHEAGSSLLAQPGWLRVTGTVALAPWTTAWGGSWWAAGFPLTSISLAPHTWPAQRGGCLSRPQTPPGQGFGARAEPCCPVQISALPPSAGGPATSDLAPHLPQVNTISIQ